MTCSTEVLGAATEKDLTSYCSRFQSALVSINRYIFCCLDRAESQEDEVLFPPEEVSSVLTNVKKLLQYDTRRRQATAIVLMGVIGAEFQKEIEMYAGRSSTENKRQAAGTVSTGDRTFASSIWN